MGDLLDTFYFAELLHLSKLYSRSSQCLSALKQAVHHEYSLTVMLHNTYFQIRMDLHIFQVERRYSLREM